MTSTARTVHAPPLSWYSGTGQLLIPMLPDTVAAAAIGRRLPDVVSHAALDRLDAVITHARRDPGENRTTLTLDPRGFDVPLDRDQLAATGKAARTRREQT